MLFICLSMEGSFHLFALDMLVTFENTRQSKCNVLKSMRLKQLAGYSIKVHKSVLYTKKVF